MAGLAAEPAEAARRDHAAGRPAGLCRPAGPAPGDAGDGPRGGTGHNVYRRNPCRNKSEVSAPQICLDHGRRQSGPNTRMERLVKNFPHGSRCRFCPSVLFCRCAIRRGSAAFRPPTGAGISREASGEARTAGLDFRPLPVACRFGERHSRRAGACFASVVPGRWINRRMAERFAGRQRNGRPTHPPHNA